MARAGEIIENPATGERIRFRKTAEDTDGRSLEFDYYLEPGGFVVASHVHPRQEERLEVVDGALDVRIDGDEWTATSGTAFTVPAGVLHRVWNDGDEDVHVSVTLRPAMDIAAFFETLFGLAREGKTDRKGRPNPLQSAVIASEFRDEIRLPWIPVPVQRALFTALGAIGRAVGYRARYPEYSR